MERENPAAAPAIPKSPPAPYSPAAPPALLDVAARPAPPFSVRDWLFPAIMLALCGAGFLATRLLVGRPLLMGTTVAACAVAGLVVCILTLHRRGQSLDSALWTTDDDHTLLSQLSEKLAQGTLDLAEVARALARRGPPLAIRIHSGEAPPIEPFDVEFEPRLLNEADAGFRALALRPEEIHESDERSPVRRHAARAWRAGAWGFSLYALAHVIYYAVEAWQTHWLHPKLLAWLICLAVSTLIPFFHFTPLPRPIIVPGGLVMRQPHWVAGKFGTQLLRPAECVLIVHQTGRDKWGWVVGSRSGVESGTATGIETRTLLRAWLSPLPPPSLDRVRRLFGGEA